MGFSKLANLVLLHKRGGRLVWFLSIYLNFFGSIFWGSHHFAADNFQSTPTQANTSQHPMSSSSSSSEEELDRIDAALRQVHRAPRTYGERRLLTFEGPDHVFRERFRLSKDAAANLVERLAPSLVRDTDRSHPLTPQEQVLTFLRWAGSDSFYHVVRDCHGMSKASVCRIVRDVSSAIVENMEAEYICFGEPRQQARDFEQIAGMPAVVGCVDGTHIRVSPPRADEAAFVNRHHQHSLNVLICSGADYRIQFVSAQAPWSWHNAHVLRNSRLFLRPSRPTASCPSLAHTSSATPPTRTVHGS